MPWLYQPVVFKPASCRIKYESEILSAPSIVVICPKLFNLKRYFYCCLNFVCLADETQSIEIILKNDLFSITLGYEVVDLRLRTVTDFIYLIV